MPSSTDLWPPETDDALAWSQTIATRHAIVTWCNALAGQGAALRELLLGVLREHVVATPHTQDGWVLRSVDAPSLLMSIHNCDSLAAYRQAMSGERVQQQLATLTEGAPSLRVYHWQTLYENMGVRPTFLTGVQLVVAPGHAAALEELLRVHTAPRLKPARDLVLRVSYHDASAPHRVFLLHGWRSEPASGAVMPAVAESVEPALAALGAQRSRWLGYP